MGSPTRLKINATQFNDLNAPDLLNYFTSDWMGEMTWYIAHIDLRDRKMHEILNRITVSDFQHIFNATVYGFEQQKSSGSDSIYAFHFGVC